MLKEWLSACSRTRTHFARLRRQRPSLLFLDERWSHHGAHSGYLIRGRSAPELYRGDRVFPHPVYRLVARVTGDNTWEARWLAQLMLRSARARSLHLVSGDFDDWLYRKRARWLKTTISATFHQPPDRLAQIAKSLRAGMLDGIVCVSREQIAVLRHLVPEGRCVFIPHGVDTEFFSAAPPPSGIRQPLLLAVGAHRRDYGTLLAAARIIKSRHAAVRVLLVAPHDAVASVAASGVVETASGLDDIQLRDAYREATMLFLPLDAATANNALLESMATARPAVITDLPAIHDYTTHEAALFCARGDPQAHAQAALSLLDDPGRCSSMGEAARARALEFAWPRVRAAMLEFLAGIAGQSH
jgi:glycosyltransferase involved in cell wall biosynthesis